MSECHGVTDPAIGFDPVTGVSPSVKRALNDMLGGGAASILTVTFGLSYSLLIFAGPLSPYLSYGIAATFISSAVLAAVIGLGSSLPFAIAAPDSSTAAVTGILAASLVEHIESANLSAPLLSPLPRFANGTTLLELGAACAMALVLYLTWHRSRNPFGLPIILVGGVITAHLAFWITGVS